MPQFLDGQRIANLTSYLQELHSQNLANSDITTLLLNCYAKLKDTARLDGFIKRSSVSATGALPFDLDTAIRVCRQSGYFDHAVYLAEKYDQPEEYLRIQIEDRDEWRDAVRYIRALPQEAAVANLRRYGKTLLANLPGETTELFIDLCCGTADRPSSSALETAPQANGAQDVSSKDTAGRSSYLSYLALGGKSSSPANVSPAAAGSAGRASGSAGVPPARRAPPELVVSDGNPARGNSGDSTGAMMASPLPLTEPLPEIRQFFAHFVDQPAYFIRFLETIAARRWGQSLDGERTSSTSTSLGQGVAARAGPSDQEHVHTDEAEQREQEAVWNTLVELYLLQALGSGSGPSEAAGKPGQNSRSQLEDKALRVIRQAQLQENGDSGGGGNGTASPIPLDVTQALLVCTTAEFVPGILAIYEQLGMYESIVRFWMDQPEPVPVPTTPSQPDFRASATVTPSEEVVATLNRYGPEGHPELYPLVLRYLTSSATLYQRHQADLLNVLGYIHTERIMPPIAVVQALSKTGIATVGLVKEYLRKQIVNEQEDVDAVSTVPLIHPAVERPFRSRAADASCRSANACAGPRSHRVVPRRPGAQGTRDQGALGPACAACVPRDAVQRVRRVAGPARGALYVPALVPPALPRRQRGLVPCVRSASGRRARDSAGEREPPRTARRVLGGARRGRGSVWEHHRCVWEGHCAAI